MAALLALLIAFMPIQYAFDDLGSSLACRPTTGEITGRMGDPRPGGRAHAGIDIKAPRGTTIHAAFDGVVSDIRYEAGAGGVVVELTHLGGFQTKYMHMFDPGMGWDPGIEYLPLPVQVGDEVEACDVIGYVGSSGLSAYPHLHFSFVPPTGFNLDPETIDWDEIPQTRVFRWWDVDNGGIAFR